MIEFQFGDGSAQRLKSPGQLVPLVKFVRTFRARHHDDGIAAPFARFPRNSVFELCSRNGPRARVRGMVCCLGVLLRRTRRRGELL